MNEHSTHTARREDARHGDGTFGAQTHTAPETALAVADFRSDHARALDVKLVELRSQRDEVMDARREEHLLDIARRVPANITKITFRTDIDSHGEEDEVLLFDSAEDDMDTVNLDPSLTSHLYAVAVDFGTPGDFVAADWMESEKGADEAYYVIDLDEDTAVAHAESFRSEIDFAQRVHGIAPLHLHFGNVAWTERAMRVRARQAGIVAILLHIPEDAAGVEVVGFEHVDRGAIDLDDGNGDHMFIAGQAQNLPHRTESMTETKNPAAPLTLEV